MRKKGKRRPKLSDTDLVSIVDRVLVGNEFGVDVARAYRVTPARVSQLVKKVSTDVSLLKAKRDKHYSQQNRLAVIKQ